MTEKQSGVQRKKRLRALDLAEIALMTALMVVGAFVSIPFPFVPLTFQTVIACLSGILLGWKKGAASMTIYMLMGLLGLPVFSGDVRGGLMYVTIPSFGYIIGFIACAIVGGVVRGKRVKTKLSRYFIAVFCALVTDYAIGIVYFAFVWNVLGNIGTWGAIASYHFIYFPKDCALCVLAALLAYKISPVLNKK